MFNIINRFLALLLSFPSTHLILPINLHAYRINQHHPHQFPYFGFLVAFLQPQPLRNHLLPLISRFSNKKKYELHPQVIPVIFVAPLFILLDLQNV